MTFCNPWKGKDAEKEPTMDQQELKILMRQQKSEEYSE